MPGAQGVHSVGALAVPAAQGSHRSRKAAGAKPERQASHCAEQAETLSDTACSSWHAGERPPSVRTHRVASGDACWPECKVHN